MDFHLKEAGLIEVARRGELHRRFKFAAACGYHWLPLLKLGTKC